MNRLLTTWTGQVEPEWVDYNHHLNDAYYMVIFSFATDGFLDTIGLDPATRVATGRTMFTLEVHLNYLQELKVETAVEVKTQVLAADTKRVRLFHTLCRPGLPAIHATNEQTLLHVALDGPKATTFAPDIQARIDTLVKAHASLPWHAHAGRAITFGNPRTDSA
jgi:acyl-CoA thioester hydrolase